MTWEAKDVNRFTALHPRLRALDVQDDVALVREEDISPEQNFLLQEFGFGARENFAKPEGAEECAAGGSPDNLNPVLRPTRGS